MSDEFSSLRNVAVVDEDSVRRDVEASIIAQSSPEALQDERKLKAAWAALQGAEKRVEQLDQQLRDAERDRAIAEAGVRPIGLGEVGSGSNNGNSNNNSNNNMGTIKYQLNVARRDLTKNEQALRRVQSEVEARQKKRIADAKAEDLRRTEANNRRSSPAGMVHAPSDPASPTASNAGVLRRTIQEGSRTALRRFLPPGSGGPTQPSPSSSSTPAVRRRAVASRPLDHLNGISMEAYSGGEVLPAINRVHVTRADIKAKECRYRDDGDEEAFAERQMKRRRLDMTKAIMEHQQEQQHQRTTVKVKKEEPAALVKSEPVEEEVTSSAAPSPPPQPSAASPPPPDVEVIDVDALMEDADDVAPEFLQQYFKKENTDAPRRTRDVDAPSPPSSPLDTDDMNALEKAYAALHLPPEPLVTLIPGMTMPQSLYDRLLDYQQEGLRWLLHLHGQRCGGILGDEMGLGKTVQIAALLNVLHASHQLRGPAIIVVPMTVLRQWVAELHRWAPHIRVCVMHDSSSSTRTREDLVDSIRATPSIVVTTYAAMRLYTNLLQSAGPHYIILDEGHKICNPDANITLAAKSFATPHRLILSGSPIQNSLRELWCLFDFVSPGLLGTLSKFIEEFQNPISVSKNVRATPLALATAVECAKALQHQIAPYLLRRLKKDVNISLPRKFERVIRVPLSDEQLDQYVDVVASPTVQRLMSQTLYHTQLYGSLNRDGRDASGSLHVAGRSFNLRENQKKNAAGIRLEGYRVMHQLRQICNHADLFSVRRGADEESRLDLPKQASELKSNGGRCFRSNNPVNLQGGSKLQVLHEMLQEWKRFGHRALVFSQTRMVLDILENLCEQEGFRYIRMDGTTSSHHRQELMDRYNEDDSIFVALLTTRVGGIGVNLVGADRVVIYDPDWNPISDVQARERAWRIGQTRDVCVYRLITSGTVEETILRRQLAKTYVADKVLKDPTLQRFFHQQDSLVESFFLGAEYDARVPLGKKHVMVAQEFHAAPLADDPGGEQERDAARDDVNGSPTGDGSSHGPIMMGPDGSDSTAAAAAEVQVKSEKKSEEREFGTLVAVTTEERAHENASGSAGVVELHAASPTAPRAPAGGRGSNAASDETETSLLKNLLDGQDVVITGSDPVAQSLARARAQQTMMRLTNVTSREALDTQREQFSLTYAAEQHAAKDAAEQAERGRWYRRGEE